MMTLVYGNSDFNDLLQESYLSGTAILTGIEYLQKAELYNDQDGLFYSSFFSLSIGIERFLKIALVTEYMYQNNFVKPSEQFLKGPGHNLVKLYKQSIDLVNKYEISSEEFNENDLEYKLINFLSNYATTNRYINLNNLTNANFKNHNHPIKDWLSLSEDFLKDSIKIETRERDLLKYYKKYENYTLRPTNILDFDGHPLFGVDLLRYKFIVNKSKPFILFRLIQLLRPIYKMLDRISMDCNNGPNADFKGPVKLPYYGELFPFFYAQLEQFKKVKRWVGRYN